ncbi:MAG: HIRAN domain-containing protein [Burkholderiales bacterium]|nr:HIRAN domain-containing protein [Burkholderiales bacterium]
MTVCLDHLWLDASQLCEPDGLPRLWLRLGDGRVLAFRCFRTRAGDEGLIDLIVERIASDLEGRDCVLELPGARQAELLDAAPVNPFVRMGSRAIRGARLLAARQRWLSGLDQGVLELLDRLTRDCGGQHRFASCRNYNCLLLLDAERRRRRMQALERFPALVAPLLLTAHRDFSLHRARPHAERVPSEAVEAAIDAGRDLVGALAAEYGISRGLVRAPLQATYWAWRSEEERRGLLRFIDALPPQKRPVEAEQLSAVRVLIEAYLALIDPPETPQAPKTLAAAHRGAFRLGWQQTWRALMRHGLGIVAQLGDVGDFLANAARIAAAEPDPAHDRSPHAIAAAWLMEFGLTSLVRASERWHAWVAHRPPAVATGFVLPALIGRYAADGVEATELLTAEALGREGEAMQHCVGSYWMRCVDGARIFSLRAANGERATAQYELCYWLSAAARGEAAERGEETLEEGFRLVQLRGPGNAPASPALEAWAHAFAAVLNAPERAAARQAVLSARRLWDRLTGADTDRSPNAAAVPLDPQSATQLARVLERIRRAPPEPWTVLRCPVAGYAYHDGPRFEASIKVGDTLALVPEPDNPHDARAIALHWQGRRIGYVPRAHNRRLHELLQEGVTLKTWIDAFDHSAAAWSRCVFRVLAEPPMSLAPTSPVHPP